MINFYKTNIEQEPKLSEIFEVRHIPHFVMISKDGGVSPGDGALNKETEIDNNSYTVPANAWTHPPTQDSITPFKLKRPPKINQPYQELFVPDKFTINYPCHPSITGAFTTCGPNGFSGFCPASNNSFININCPSVIEITFVEI